MLELLSVPAVVVADHHHYSYGEAPDEVLDAEVEEIFIHVDKERNYHGAYVYVWEE